LISKIQPNQQQPTKTIKYQHYIPFQFGLYMVFDEPEFQKAFILFEGAAAHIKLL
jgi:hypothetical protein